VVPLCKDDPPIAVYRRREVTGRRVVQLLQVASPADYNPADSPS
jgi:hypothetical protein